ncbi:SAM-dependent methyltransferase (plasmid) [Cupriavidus pinatubonensis]|uniref:N-6 DNA methylase n=1 Tax=Cupriavidus pinatubonensis TaxID=248026 RepID=UPI001C7382EC|nr:N-6 DNA methylase [Cupriavidus pinatubonensis]QYY33584.1 SAM-dependent methyltransferase [Cupriavidus pinatubonensis]
MKQRQLRAVNRGSAASEKLEIVRLLRTAAYRRRMDEVWSDFVALAAITFAQLDRRSYAEREVEYLRIVRRYTRDEFEALVQAFIRLPLAFEANVGPGGVPIHFADILGELFMALDLGNSAMGQFFTPNEVSRLVAAMTIDRESIAGHIARNGFVSVHEPAMGGGAMLIQFAAIMAEVGFNYQKQMVAVGVDLSLTAVHMCYIQMALLHIPAVLICGNSLTLETRSVWYTPAYIIGGWASRFPVSPHEPMREVAQRARPRHEIEQEALALVADQYFAV